MAKYCPECGSDNIIGEVSVEREKSEEYPDISFVDITIHCIPCDKTWNCVGSKHLNT